jgi:hypothetical protein
MNTMTDWWKKKIPSGGGGGGGGWVEGEKNTF